jgi:hypothetical protein
MILLDTDHLSLIQVRFSTTAASLGRATGFLCCNDRCGFERPRPIIGVENERLIDGLPSSVNRRRTSRSSYTLTGG